MFRNEVRYINPCITYMRLGRTFALDIDISKTQPLFYVRTSANTTARVKPSSAKLLLQNFEAKQNQIHLQAQAPRLGQEHHLTKQLPTKLSSHHLVGIHERMSSFSLCLIIRVKYQMHYHPP